MTTDKHIWANLANVQMYCTNCGRYAQAEMSWNSNKASKIYHTCCGMEYVIDETKKAYSSSLQDARSAKYNSGR